MPLLCALCYCGAHGRLRKFWNKTAQRYANSPVGDERTYRRKLAETQEFLTADMRVLEFGCGTGSTAIEHAPHVQHIDAVDISENMLQIGRDKAAAASVNNIHFAQGTLTEFNAEPASYDAVLGLNVIHLVPDRQAVLAEAARVLKPGGIFVSSTVCLGNSYLRFLTLLVPLGKLFGLLPDVFVFKEGELVQQIESAGFKIERCWHHGKGGIAVFIIARKV